MLGYLFGMPLEWADGFLMTVAPGQYFAASVAVSAFGLGQALAYHYIY